MDTATPILHKKRFRELTVDELYELLRARSEVFVVEQDCVYQDMDGDDQASIHLWLTVDDTVVAVCRVCPAGTHMKEVSIGRVITTVRGKGYGKRIMLEGIQTAREDFGATRIDIEAQEYARGFYERVGFRQSSDQFILDGIPHIRMTYMEEPILNAHNKEEYPPSHTAEHILNGTMVKLFGCPRSRNAHVERKKCKCDYELPACPTPGQVAQIEATVNEVIGRNLDVTISFLPREEAAAIVDLSKLPEDASPTLRIVRIGDYDACACIGAHVDNTSQIGTFKILSHDFENGRWRVRWKVTNNEYGTH